MEKEKELLKRAMIEFVPLGLGQNEKWDIEINKFMQEYFDFQNNPTPDLETFKKKVEAEAKELYPNYEHFYLTDAFSYKAYIKGRMKTEEEKRKEN